MYKSSRAEVFQKKVFLTISQKAQEDTACAGVSFLIKLQVKRYTSLLRHRCMRFLVNFTKFRAAEHLRTAAPEGEKQPESLLVLENDFL